MASPCRAKAFLQGDPDLKVTPFYCHDVNATKYANNVMLVNKLCNQIVCTVTMLNILWCKMIIQDKDDCF